MAWWLHHFPGQPVPMLDNPFAEEIFLNIQSKHPLAQHEAIFCCAITCYLGKETKTHLATTFFQAAVESNKVSPQPPLLQTKQPQFPQLLLTGPVLQTLHQLCRPALDTLQHLNVLLSNVCPKHSTRGVASPVPSTGARSLFYSCWPHHSWHQPECCWPSWPPGPTGGSRSASGWPAPPGPFLPGSFPTTLPQACSSAWGVCVCVCVCDPSAGTESLKETSQHCTASAQALNNI